MSWQPVEPVWRQLFIPDPPGRADLSSATALLEPLEDSVRASTSTLDDPLICYCFGIPKSTIRKAALAHELQTAAEVTQATKAGGGCGSCHPDLEDVLGELWAEVQAKGYVVMCHELGVTPGGEDHADADEATAAAFDALPSLARVAKITDVLNKEVRPFLQGDGGDLSLIDIDGNRVIVNLVGSCSSCSASALTLRGLVEERLRQYVSPRLEVIAV